jgi:hypothetical protein
VEVYVGEFQFLKLWIGQTLRVCPYKICKGLINQTPTKLSFFVDRDKPGPYEKITPP